MLYCAASVLQTLRSLLTLIFLCREKVQRFFLSFNSYPLLPLSLCTSAPGLPGSAPGRVSEVQLLHSPTTKSFAPNLPGLELGRVSDVRLRDTVGWTGELPLGQPAIWTLGETLGGEREPQGAHSRRPACQPTGFLDFEAEL